MLFSTMSLFWLCSSRSLLILQLLSQTVLKWILLYHTLRFVTFSWSSLVKLHRSESKKPRQRDLTAEVLLPLGRYSYWQCWGSIGINVQKMFHQLIIHEQIIFLHMLHIHYISQIIIFSTHNDCPTDRALFSGLRGHLMMVHSLFLQWSPSTQWSLSLICWLTFHIWLISMWDTTQRLNLSQRLLWNAGTTREVSAHTDKKDKGESLAF